MSTYRAPLTDIRFVLDEVLLRDDWLSLPGNDELSADLVDAVLAEADCQLLLDVNNIYVNSINHRYDAEAFLQQIPAERIGYIHVAGHYNEAEDLLVDTHGATVTDPVWALLEKTYARCGVIPTLLERDFNIPPLPELLGEVDQIARLQATWSRGSQRSVATHG